MRTPFLPLLLCTAWAVATAGESPHPEPRWERDDAGAIVALPAEGSDVQAEPHLVVPGPDAPLAAWIQAIRHAGPLALLAIATGGGHDLASLGDAGLYFRRMGYATDRAALLARIADAPADEREAVERILAVRLLALAGDDAVAERLAAIAEGDDDPFFVAACRRALADLGAGERPPPPALDLEELVEGLGSGDEVVAVFDSARGLRWRDPGGLNRVYGEHHVERLVAIAGDIADDALIHHGLATSQSAAVLPIALALGFGNARVDAVAFGLDLSRDPEHPTWRVNLLGSFPESSRRLIEELALNPRDARMPAFDAAYSPTRLTFTNRAAPAGEPLAPADLEAIGHRDGDAAFLRVQLAENLRKLLPFGAPGAPVTFTLRARREDQEAPGHVFVATLNEDAFSAPLRAVLENDRLPPVDEGERTHLNALLASDQGPAIREAWSGRDLAVEDGRVRFRLDCSALDLERALRSSIAAETAKLREALRAEAATEADPGGDERGP